MVMDGIMHIFGVGTPSEDRLSKLVRTQIIEEAAKSDVSLIFTYVWNFGQKKGKLNIDTYKAIYEKNGGEVLFVELAAPLDVRVIRASHPERKRLKAHAPDAKKVEQLETQLDFNSPSPFFYPEAYAKIDTTDKTPEQTAQKVIELLNR